MNLYGIHDERARPALGRIFSSYPLVLALLSTSDVTPSGLGKTAVGYSTTVVFYNQVGMMLRQLALDTLVQLFV